MRIEWDSKLSVGHPKIDGEHKKMIDQINAMCDLCDNCQLQPFYMAMNDLVSGAREHFDHEERLMRAAAYPAYNDHCAKHKALIEQAVNLARDIKRGPTAAVTHSSCRFLSQWLLDHIMSDDKPLGAYLLTQKG